MGGKLVGALMFTVVTLAQIACADATEIRLYSTVAFRGVFSDLAAKYERSSGNQLAITFGNVTEIAQRIRSGGIADVIIVTGPGIDELIKDSAIVSGTNTKLAIAGTAVAVKAGAPKPDISSPEALKRTLLNARSITYGNPAGGGVSGVYAGKLIDKMDIAEQLKDRTKFPPAGKLPAELIATGEVELGIMQTSELVPGTELVGVLPGELNNITVFAAGLGAKASDPSAAKTLIQFLQSPEASAIYKARGLNPA
jgi:molybdate transport system substrate-binding protein